MVARNFIGSGIAFPVAVNDTGSLAVSSEEDNIRQSMMMILGTAYGERLYRPEFGCGIHDILFEPNNDLTAARVEYEVKKSLSLFEPRIKNIEVRATPDPDEQNRMNVKVNYIIRSNNTSQNMVYPFYLRNEGEI